VITRPLILLITSSFRNCKVNRSSLRWLASNYVRVHDNDKLFNILELLEPRILISSEDSTVEADSVQGEATTFLEPIWLLGIGQQPLSALNVCIEEESVSFPIDHGAGELGSVVDRIKNLEGSLARLVACAENGGRRSVGFWLEREG